MRKAEDGTLTIDHLDQPARAFYENRVARYIENGYPHESRDLSIEAYKAHILNMAYSETLFRKLPPAAEERIEEYYATAQGLKILDDRVVMRRRRQFYVASRVVAPRIEYMREKKQYETR